VLTDYERLPEVVPNLAVCERVQTPTGMSSRVTRLRQVSILTFASTLTFASIAILDLVLTPASILRQPSVFCQGLFHSCWHNKATPDTAIYICDLGFTCHHGPGNNAHDEMHCWLVIKCIVAANTV